MGNVERLLVRHSERVAVLLNANARNVSETLKRELENFVPPDDLYISRCFDDARSIARSVLERGYGTVLTGGGDGTFVGYVNCLFEEAMQRPGTADGRNALKLAPVPAHRVRLPRFGVLKLGTGNALADFAGASARRVGVVEDILRARSGECSASRPLHLLVHEGKRAHFAGLGIDARLLNDYVSIKDRVGSGGLARSSTAAPASWPLPAPCRITGSASRCSPMPCARRAGSSCGSLPSASPPSSPTSAPSGRADLRPPASSTSTATRC